MTAQWISRLNARTEKYEPQKVVGYTSTSRMITTKTLPQMERQKIYDTQPAEGSQTFVQLP